MHTSRFPRAPVVIYDGPLPAIAGRVLAGNSDPTTWISRAPGHTEHPFLRAFYGQPADPDQRA